VIRNTSTSTQSEPIEDNGTAAEMPKILTICLVMLVTKRDRWELTPQRARNV
jgi:hypothetical protein